MPAPLPSLPGFRLRSFIGAGPCGRVYRAYDELRGREVAVKLLDPRRCTPRGLARLAEIAARAAASPVARPDQLYEVVADPGRPFVVMDILPGESLQQLLLRTGPVSWKKARAIAHAIAVALEAAHDVGAVHGAVKPTNIFFHGSLVILTDFGSRAVADPRDRELLLADAGRHAPEQLRGEEPDARADVYGLGLVLFELVTGRLPFVGDPHQILQHQLRHPPPAPRTFIPDLPAAADALISELLARQPEQRPPTASRLRGLLSASERLPDHDLSMADRMSWRRPIDLPFPHPASPSVDAPTRVFRPAHSLPMPAAAAIDIPPPPDLPAAPDSPDPPSPGPPPEPHDFALPLARALVVAAITFTLVAGLTRACL